MGVYLFHAASTQYHAVISKGYALTCLKMRFSRKRLPPTLPSSPKRSIAQTAHWPPSPWAISMRRFCTKFKGADSISTHPHKDRLNFFTAVSQEIVGLLNQYVQGAIDVEHFINRYATMARMMMLESALH